MLIHKYFGKMSFVLVCFMGLLGISTAIEITLGTSEYTNIHSPNFPLPYPDFGTWKWTIAPGGGSGVEFIIRDFDLCSDYTDHLLIGPGQSSSDPELPLMFTYHLKTERKYRILYRDDIYIDFNAVNNKDKCKGFSMDLKRIMETPTTTETLTTEEIANTIYPYENHTVYLKGKDHHEFYKNDSEQFRINLANAAEKFCLKYKIPIDDDIVIVENVNYHRIGPCNVAWPIDEKCVEVIYSIGVSYDNISDVYELSNANLKKMWAEYQADINLNDMKLTVYDPPINRAYVSVWIGIFVGVTLLFGIILVLIWRFNCFRDMRMSMRLIENEEVKKGDESLFPIPYQSVPPLVGSDYYGVEDNDHNSEMQRQYGDNPNSFEAHENFGYSNDESEDIIDKITMTLPSSNYSNNSHPARMRASIDTIENDESVL